MTKQQLYESIRRNIKNSIQENLQEAYIKQLREGIRRIIKQTLNEALTPEEQQELEEIEYELRYNIQSKSAVSPSMYKRYKELKAKQELAENQPAKAPSKPSPGPAVAPGKPSTDKPKPRRPLGNPDIAKDPDQRPKPKAIKATMTEADMLARIIKRFKSKG
jgi:DNA primase